MISITLFEPGNFQALQSALLGSRGTLRKEMEIISWAAAKKAEKYIVRQIDDELALKQDVIKQHTSAKKLVSGQTVGAEVELEKHPRVSLKHFTPKQKKTGTSYTIGKTGGPKGRGGRQTAPGAFMGPKPGMEAPRLHGNVFKRIGWQKSNRNIKKGIKSTVHGPRLQTSEAKRTNKKRIREPLIKLMGVSPWGVFVKNDMTAMTKEDINKNIKKELDRRIRFHELKKAGKLRGNQSAT